MVINLLCKDFIKSLENTYSDDTYFNVVGWDIELENFEAECEARGIPTESRIYPVCVYRGIHIKGLYFHKDFQDIVKKIVYDNGGYGRLVLNGSNPFV